MVMLTGHRPERLYRFRQALVLTAVAIQNDRIQLATGELGPELARPPSSSIYLSNTYVKFHDKAGLRPARPPGQTLDLYGKCSIFSDRAFPAHIYVLSYFCGANQQIKAS
jgi:hypothetical protein